MLELGLEFEFAVALPPPSDGSSGICTFKTGRLPPPILAELVREGGAKPSEEDMETFLFLWVCDRTGGGGEVLPRETAPTSTDCDRLDVGGGCSAFDVEDAQC